MRDVSLLSRDSRSVSIAPRAWATLLCKRLLVVCKRERDGILVGKISKTKYLTSFGYAPLLPVEDADSTYVVFAELLDQPIPPKNVSMLMGSRSKVEPLSNESGVADDWKQVSFNLLCRIERKVAHKTTAFPCSSLNRDGTLLSTWGLVIESVSK